jgi:hypothetical protein
MKTEPWEVITIPLCQLQVGDYVVGYGRATKIDGTEVTFGENNIKAQFYSLTYKVAVAPSGPWHSGSHVIVINHVPSAADTLPRSNVQPVKEGTE